MNRDHEHQPNATGDMWSRTDCARLLAAQEGGSRLIVCARNCSSIESSGSVLARVFQLVFVVISLFCGQIGTAQERSSFPPENTVMIGIGGLPGLGAIVGYVEPARTYTREAIVYSNVIIPIGDREGSAYVAVVIGGSLRVIGVGEAMGLLPIMKYDLDVGVRIGPSLIFELDETRADKNKRFNIAAEPFLRFAREMGRNRRTFYAEAGLIRPTLRIGIWLGV